MAFFKCSRKDSFDLPQTNGAPKSTQIFNTALLPLRAHFFFFFGGLACVIPSLILYSQQLGASISMIGMLFAVTPFMQLIAKPTGGAIADKLQRHKAVFVTCVVTYAISLFSINFIPKVSVEPADDTGALFASNHSNHNYPPFANTTLCRLAADDAEWQVTSPTLASCLIVSATRGDYLLACRRDTNGSEHSPEVINPQPSCNFRSDTVVGNSRIRPNRGNGSLSSSNQLAGSTCSAYVSAVSSEGFEIGTLLPLRIFVGADCESGEHPDTVSGVWCTARSCLPVVSGRVESVPYLQFTWLFVGVVSAFSMYSVALSISDAMLLTSLADDRQGDYGKSRMFGTIGWGLMSPVAACLIDWFSQGQPLKNYSPGYYAFAAFLLCDLLVCVPFLKVTVKDKPKRLLIEVSRLFRLAKVLLFALATVWQGVIIAVCWTYVVIFANELNGTQTNIGLNYAVECFLSEIPSFLISGWLLRRVSHAHALTLTLFVSGLKALCYSFIDNAWFMLPIALMHGATYGVFYATMATFANQIAPPGGSATLQGIFQGLFEGIGNGIGNLIGGFVYERLGGRRTFRLFGLATMGVALLHLFATLCLNKYLEKPATKLPQKVEIDHSST